MSKTSIRTTESRRSFLLKSTMGAASGLYLLLTGSGAAVLQILTGATTVRM